MDFIWLAAIVLWDRLAPDVVNFEKIDGILEEAYDLYDDLRTKDACDLWFEAWDYLKELIPLKFKDIEELNEISNGLHYPIIWTQDLAIYLHNAGLEDPEYYQKRINYIMEVLDRFPHSDDDYLFNMKRALGETYFLIGQEEKGEELFNQLIEHYPEYSWGYILWGDQYADIDSKRYNYEKIKSIYELALKRKASPKEDVSLRIKSLEREKEGLKFRKTLITRYRSSLSQEKLDENGIQAKMEHIKNFLNYVIFSLRMYNFEKILELLEPKDIRIFLGTWIIQHEYVSSETELIDYCKDIKAFLVSILSDDRYPEVLLDDIEQLCDSDGYFLPFFETYQDIIETTSTPKEFQSKLIEWKNTNTYSYWYAWNKFNPEKEEEEPEKVRLSEEKRKLFGDMDHFL